MNRLRLVLLLALLVPAGCDKASKLFGDKLSGALGDGEIPSPGGEVTGDFSALVKRSDDGVYFRRDLPFPPEIEGTVRTVVDCKQVRVLSTSAIGPPSSEVVNGRFETRVNYLKRSGEFLMTLDKADRAVVDPEKEKEEGTPLPSVAPTRESSREGKCLHYLLGQSGWYHRAPKDGHDFDLVVWSDSIGTRLPDLMVEAGAHPRPQWFSSARAWRKGDRIVLTGGAIKLLEPYEVSGRVVLVFDGEQAVGGHPCGVFTLEGAYSVKDRTGFHGRRENAEVTISKGKVWASLVYPVLIREEYETVQTISSEQGGAKSESQGAMQVTRSRLWTPKR